MSPNIDIWWAWSKVHYEQEVNDLDQILDQTIWGNSHIRKRNRPIFDKDLLQSNIEKIIDIYDPETQSLFTFEQINDTFGNVISYMQYLSIRAAIPSKWKTGVKREKMQGELDYTPLQATLAQCKSASPSKQIYWKEIENTFPTVNHMRVLTQLWSKEVQPIELDEWKQLLINFMKIVKPKKLQFFQFQLLNRILTTNIIRHKWHKEVSEACTFCKVQKETVTHLLYKCEKVNKLWKTLTKWCKYYLSINIEFSMSMVIFNNYRGKDALLVNLFIVVLKQYIYAAKCFKERPTLTAFTAKLSYWYNVEKKIALEKNKLVKHQRKWKNIF